jgi:hypothetical protein
VLGVAAGRPVTIVHNLGLSGFFYTENAWIETYVPKLNTRTGGIEATFTWKGDGDILIDGTLLKAAREKAEREGRKTLTGDPIRLDPKQPDPRQFDPKRQETAVRK